MFQFLLLCCITALLITFASNFINSDIMCITHYISKTHLKISQEVLNALFNKKYAIFSIVTDIYSSLTILHRSVACPNIMGGGVPTQSIVQRVVSLHHFKILSYYLGHYPRSISSPSAYASLPSPNQIPYWSQYCRSFGNPGLRPSATAMSKIGRVAMYWPMVL